MSVKNKSEEELRETAEEEKIEARVRVIEYLMSRRRERLSKEDKAHE